jgi:hypothetical protein
MPSPESPANRTITVSGFFDVVVTSQRGASLIAGRSKLRLRGGGQQHALLLTLGISQRCVAAGATDERQESFGIGPPTASKPSSLSPIRGARAAAIIACQRS